MNEGGGASGSRCPFCGSTNTSPAEQAFPSDYPFLMVLAAVFLLAGAALLLFFVLQLHPVILILVLVAAASKLLDAGRKARRRTSKSAFICLDCDRRFFRRRP